MATKKDEQAPETTNAAELSAQAASEGDTGSEYDNVRVKISAKVFENTSGQGAYYDPGTKKTIGAKAVTVPTTEFIQALLRSQEIVKG